MTLTRRSLLRGTAGLLAAGAVTRPFVANAQATTITAWFGQGFVPEEDASLKRLVADYEKTSGNKVNLSIVPFAPLRQKEVSAITSGSVPDVMEPQDLQFGPLQAWQGHLLDLSDIVEERKSYYSENALVSTNLYDNEAKRRAYHMVPMKTFATPFHIWRSLVEKGGGDPAALPKTWDAFIDYFKPIQKRLQAQGMRHTYATGFVVSTIGVDPVNTFNAFTVAYGGHDMVAKDGKFHGRDPHVHAAIVKMLAKLSGLFKQRYIPPSSLNWQDADDNNAFHSKLW